MKTTILTLSLLATALVSGQTSGNVTLNVNLHSIQSLTINPSQEIVDLDYYTKADYLNGVSSLQQDHLEVYSTGGFKIQVTSSDLVNPNETIPVSTITLVASDGSDALIGVDYSPTILSSSPTTIVSSNLGGADKTFNVEYQGGGSNQYLNKYHSGEEPTTYTTIITYTISPL